MLGSSLETLRRQAKEWGGRPDSRMAAVSDIADDLARHFRENCPILLDGALPLHADSGHFARLARESLARGRVDPDRLPAAILRETLDAIQASAKPATKAGLTAVGPRRARVWWDAALVEEPADILADLDKPRPVLRFYDVTGLDPQAGSWNETFDIDVSLADKGKSIDFWSSERAYVVELGHVCADGRFVRLARTNIAELPRERPGHAGDAGVARSNLRRSRRLEALVPDAAAREWAEARRDSAVRDLETELAIHMLYRAFLAEGPRALRRAPRLFPRDAELLRREYLERGRSRQRRQASRGKPRSPALLVARLDPTPPLAATGILYAPVPAALARANSRLLPEAPGSAEYFSLYRSALHAARTGIAAPPPPASPAVVPAARTEEPRLVQALPADAELETGMFASPVFAAAQSLRQRLSDLTDIAAEAAPADGTVVGEEGKKQRPARLRDFGGIESRRFAKAGVRVDRMTLTLEGRMRPGARLKVAGKLVYADADGRFRLDCVLTGRKASIPMRAGTSIGGEARGLINVEWERRGSNDKKRSLTTA